MSHSAPNAIKRCVAATSKHLSLNGDANKGEQAQPMVPENNLCRQYKEKVQPCIDLIDSLRALGVEQDLALPAIAVIGDQSSGKSSVLEALSGVALPRGSGIVTRCPLVLKLKKLDQEEGWRGKLSYLQVQEDIADTSKVEGAVIKAQNFITGTRLGIKDELISLEISSPSVPDLTLIDLPGITRVAVGNQPEDIGCQIKRLIMKYIEKAETINLVVVPSNVDIATTEALSMAKQVDPEGDRTIGILTKPDLVDKGTEDKVVDVVHNLLCPLKKGYMVVRCRSQQDIQARLSPTEALQREQAFFEDHPLFRVLLEEGKATVPRLAERLSSELITHICKSLPLLENTIKERHQEITEELQKYGMDIPEDGNEKTIFLIQKISAFNKDIRALVEGEESVGKNGTRLFARLRQKFQGWNSMIEEHFEKGYDGLKSKVWQFESQHCGKELPGFVNYRTFETLMKSQLQALEEPAVELLHEVTVMVRDTFTAVSERNFSGFFNLHKTCKVSPGCAEKAAEIAREQASLLPRAPLRCPLCVGEVGARRPGNSNQQCGVRAGVRDAKGNSRSRARAADSGPLGGKGPTWMLSKGPQGLGRGRRNKTAVAQVCALRVPAGSTGLSAWQGPSSAGLQPQPEGGHLAGLGPERASALSLRGSDHRDSVGTHPAPSLTGSGCFLGQASVACKARAGPLWGGTDPAVPFLSPGTPGSPWAPFRQQTRKGAEG
ncbi:Interferon-induced GTP-binding protein Mx1 [Heterocephalus glaber]|uniref:Interferon-induced GTP-binding protein Mx1 n=1 Tax=Heterocephalus glaber TaxID=10181 RepID=G5C5C9_HETGA|nr:Interferon-induced GTP-binding protein Mx1 [Heterocephalus glaber]